MSLVMSLLIAGCTPRSIVSGLRPKYPEPDLDWYASGLGFDKVDSVQPTLRWESFPRPNDRAGDRAATQGRIHQVTYELRIFKAQRIPFRETWGPGGYLAYVGFLPGEEVYVREALLEPFHKLEKPLEPSAWYFWTVRARFKIDGHLRVTEWGVALPEIARRLPQVPNPFYYRFQTPSE